MTRTRIKPRNARKLDTKGGANQADFPATEINQIIAKYQRHGTMPAVQMKNPLYGDFTGPSTIHEQREAVYQAEDRFMELPAKVRELCENDWVQFLDKMDDPEQHDSLIQAGLTILDPSEPNINPTETTNPSPPESTPETPSE